MKLNMGVVDGFFVLWVGVVIVGAIGWIANIVKIIGMTFDGHEIEALLRGFGIVFPPLGAVMGIFV